MIRSKSGFTIVETMIFLAISGVTFVMAVTILGNQQRKTQFDQSVTYMESTMNDISNDTSTGVFPEISGVRCTTSGGAGDIQFRDDPTANPGENNECVFVGNVVQLFDANESDEKYFVHTLVGKNDPTSNSFSDTDPVPLYSTNLIAGDSNFGESGTVEFSLPWGTTIKRAFYKDSTNNTIYVRGVAYVYSNFGSKILDKTFTSGSASVGLYAAVASSNPQIMTNSVLSKSDFRDSISSQATSGNPTIYVAVPDKISICLEGVDGKKAMVDIGSESGTVSARTNFDVAAECTS